MLTILLTQGQCTVIDDEDATRVAQFHWHAGRYPTGWYAITNAVNPNTSKRRTVFLHSLLLPARAGYMVDHKDCNTLDNRRQNLRYATRSQNLANSRPRRADIPKGAYFVYGHWKAVIAVNGRCVHLGTFDTMKETGEAYARAAIEQWGEFARTVE